MRIFAESDLIVLTVPTTDRQYPFLINSKIKEYWDDVWQQTNGSQIDLLDGNPRDSIPRVRATSPESRIRFGRHH